MKPSISSNKNTTSSYGAGSSYLGVCVVFFCHDGQGHFLMAKRKNTTRDEHGHWDVGGGAVEFGQPVEKTLKKQITFA